MVVGGGPARNAAVRAAPMTGAVKVRVAPNELHGVMLWGRSGTAGLQDPVPNESRTLWLAEAPPPSGPVW